MRNTSADPDLPLTKCVAAMIVTEIHIFIRFAEYMGYPYKLSQLCAKFHPDGYILAAESFLSEDQEVLDLGYSLVLQKRALAYPHFSELLNFLLSAEVQEEIFKLFHTSHATTLGVERKNAWDRRSTTRDKSMSVARASRNSVLETYRRWRVKALDVKKRSVKTVRSMRFMNSRALAVMRNPQFFKRAQGQLHWQAPQSKRAKRRIVSAGNETALRQYQEEHAESLRADARRYFGILFPPISIPWISPTFMSQHYIL